MGEDVDIYNHLCEEEGGGGERGSRGEQEEEEERRRHCHFSRRLTSIRVKGGPGSPC